MPDGKKLFEPQSPLELLRGWLIHAHKGRDRHDLGARVYERARYAFGVPTLVVSTIVGTAVFSALASGAVPDWWVGVLSVLAAVLSALQTFLDFPTRAERHRSAGVKYKAIIRSLEQSLAEIGTGSALAPTVITSLRSQLDALEDEAPVIMPRIFDRIEKRYSGVSYVQEALGLYR
jgi:uncharacterized membrane protein YfcA